MVLLLFFFSLLNRFNHGRFAYPVFLVDHDLGYYKPHKSTELTLLIIGLSFILVQDIFSYVFEVTVVEEIAILVVLDEIAGQVEEQGSSAGGRGEELEFLEVQLFGIQVQLFIGLAFAAATEKFIEVSASQREDTGNQAILAEGTHFVLSY